MNLHDDIALLQRAADTAGLILNPGARNTTYPEGGNVTAPAELLREMAAALEARRKDLCDYRLIDYPAVWLLESAALLKLYREDANALMAERYERLGRHLRGVVMDDLAAARSSVGEIQ